MHFSSASDDQTNLGNFTGRVGCHPQPYFYAENGRTYRSSTTPAFSYFSPIVLLILPPPSPTACIANRVKSRTVNVSDEYCGLMKAVRSHIDPLRHFSPPRLPPCMVIYRAARCASVDTNSLTRKCSESTWPIRKFWLGISSGVSTTAMLLFVPVEEIRACALSSKALILACLISYSFVQHEGYNFEEFISTRYNEEYCVLSLNKHLVSDAQLLPHVPLLYDHAPNPISIFFCVLNSHNVWPCAQVEGSY